jgi:hypothetical protein
MGQMGQNQNAKQSMDLQWVYKGKAAIGQHGPGQI